LFSTGAGKPFKTIIVNVKLLFLKIKNEAFSRLSTIVDFLLYTFRLHRVAPFTFPASGLGIIFLGENLPPRIARMYKWLHRAHAVNAILVCAQNGYNPKFVEVEFSRVYLFRNKWHLYSILKKIEGAQLIHAFGPKSYFPDMARQYMPHLKFVYDMQDVLGIYFGLNTDIAWFRKEFPHEKNCLQYANGLVSHGLEPIPAYRVYNIKHKTNRLFFPLFCDDDRFVNPAPKLADGIHLVYAGEIQNSNRDKRQFGNIQFDDLIQQLSNQKIHFHVYPSPSTNPLLYNQYLEVARQNPYFHLEKPVAQSQLSTELSKYHYGIIPFFKSTSGQSSDKYKYSTALKLFNFIEAGIPTICSRDIEFQAWILKRYAAGFAVSESDIATIGNKLNHTDYTALQAELMAHRSQLSLKNNIHKLYHFYQKILA